MKAPTGGPKGRAARWRKGNDALLARLSGEQIASLRLAAAGLPPAFILGWHDQPDTGEALEPPLQAIEEITREMLRSYDWPETSGEREWPHSGFVDHAGFENWRQVGPDWRPDPARSRLRYDRGSDRVCPQYDDQGRRFEDRPDFRHELLSLIQLVTELRAAVTGGHVESAILRSMTIGTLFGRVASMALYGERIAGAAASDLCKPLGHEMLRDRLRDKLGERNDEKFSASFVQSGGTRGPRRRARARGSSRRDGRHPEAESAASTGGLPTTTPRGNRRTKSPP